MKILGTVVTYGCSGYLVLARHMLARKVNNALLSASVVLRGLKGVVQTLMLYWDADDVEEYITKKGNKDGNGNANANAAAVSGYSTGILPTLNRFLNGRGGGVLMVALTATSLIVRHIQAKKLSVMKKE